MPRSGSSRKAAPQPDPESDSASENEQQQAEEQPEVDWSLPVPVEKQMAETKLGTMEKEWKEVLTSLRQSANLLSDAMEETAEAYEEEDPEYIEVLFIAAATE